jgi:CHASE1-domain containing sensor protein
MDFAVDHGFQILGALVFLLIGLKVSGVVQDITLAAT